MRRLDPVRDAERVGTGEPARGSAGRPDLLKGSLQGLCPDCGAPTLFDGWVKFASRCRTCGLDFNRFNVGDGPAAFLTLIVGGLAVMLAIWLELSVQPPFWVHAVLWVPMVIVLVLAGLRMSKAALLHSEYRQSAGEAGSKDLRP